MKATIHGHRFGQLVIKEETFNSAKSAIEVVALPIKKSNQMQIKSDILAGLHLRGWSGEVPLAQGSAITITSVKDQVGLCFQTGNMGRMYADLLKLQALYERETIYFGIMVLFTHPAATVLAGNMAEFDRLVRELPIFERVFTAPIVVIGIEG